MLDYDMSNKSEPQTRSVVLPVRDKLVEQGFGNFLRDSGAIVRHLKPPVFLISDTVQRSVVS